MRDLFPLLSALVLPPVGISSAPGSLAADVPGLVSDIERRFAALESYCHDLGDVPPHDTEFNRLDDLVTEAIHALADAPSRDLAGMLAKAGALLRAPIEEDFDHCDRIGISLARDVLRLLGAASTLTGGHHA
ncbi:hypothetical protein D3273_13325 [Lichenibacterium minor]|uniref:Uncharacterized protein n=1 Tax=Lichenibacterium minor TaxID=2316528 RepID=A0A4Q2U8Y7_9HYPH|nr:hypothetical protein [Lichenibacterium minor]RYC31365.1 hypothetical protein D3273_13325 [Lichenibacterium minor]